MSDVMAVHALPRTLKLYDCRNLNFLSKSIIITLMSKSCASCLYMNVH